MSKKILLLLALASMLLHSAGAENMDLRWDYAIGGKGRYINVEDLDPDGVSELVVVSGDTLYVLESNGMLRWKKDINNLVSIYVSDLEWDEKKEVIASSGKSIENIARGNIWIFENSGKLRWVFPSGKVKSNKIMRGIKTVDMDDNGYKEILGGTRQGVATLADNYNEYLWYNSFNDSIESVSTELRGWILANSDYSIYLMDFEGSVEWNYSMAEGVRSVYLADFYPRAGEEIFVVSLEDSIYVLNTDGELEVDINLTEDGFDAIPLNLDDDDYDEILLTSGNVAYARDVNNDAIWEYDAGEEIRGIIAEGMVNDSILLFSDSHLHAINRDGELEHIYDPGLEYSISDAVINDLENDGEREFIISSADGVYVFNINWTQVKGEKANDYYGRADEYFAIKDYENSSLYIKMAKDIYGELGDNENVLRCSIIIAKIAAGVKDEKKALAESYYQLAEYYYNNSLYENASTYIVDALRAYIGLRDGEGIAKCNALSRRIKDAMITTSTSLPESTTSIMPETTITTTIPVEDSALGDIADKLPGMAAVLIIVLAIIFIKRREATQTKEKGGKGTGKEGSKEIGEMGGKIDEGEEIKDMKDEGGESKEIEEEEIDKGIEEELKEIEEEVSKGTGKGGSKEIEDEIKKIMEKEGKEIEDREIEEDNEGIGEGKGGEIKEGENKEINNES